jgi:hypothetical protein
MTYHDSLWKDAPEGATHCGVTEIEYEDGSTAKHWVFMAPNGKTIRGEEELFRWYLPAGIQGKEEGWRAFSRTVFEFQFIHERPTCYTPAAQLVDQYRKERGAEIEEWLASANKIDDDPMKEAETSIWLAARYMALAEHLLAAERARVEGEGK